jgi:signal transduction histidine kinase
VLYEFLTSRRAALIELCRLKVVARRAPRAGDADLEHGIPLFLGQLIETLRVEQSANPMSSRKLSGAADGEGSSTSQIGGTAAQHGLELLRHGFTVDQVVHDYGDLCQAITEMAFEEDVQVQADEFQTLNRCLDNAIADAVTEYSHGRELLIADKGAQAMNERLGFLAHELRNLIHIATLSFTAIKTGSVGPTGATGAVVDRSLLGMRNLIDRTLADVRVTAQMPARIRPVSVAECIAEVKISASLEAQSRG